jgi:hypothetical protein
MKRLPLIGIIILFMVSGCSGSGTERKNENLEVTIETIAACKVSLNGVIENNLNPLFWDWGDNTITKGYFPQEHTYAQDGTYTLVVSSTTGSTKTFYLGLTCPNK